MHRYFRQGQALPLVIIMFLVILLVLGITIDTGRYVVMQQQTKWLADAAAIAAVTKAGMLPTENILDNNTIDNVLSSEANTYIQLNNGYALGGTSHLSITVTNSIDETITNSPAVIVKALVSVPFKHKFGGLFKIKNQTIIANSTAQYDPGTNPAITLLQ